MGLYILYGYVTYVSPNSNDSIPWSSSSYSNWTLQSGGASRAILGWDLTKSATFFWSWAVGHELWRVACSPWWTHRVWELLPFLSSHERSNNRQFLFSTRYVWYINDCLQVFDPSWSSNLSCSGTSPSIYDWRQSPDSGSPPLSYSVVLSRTPLMTHELSHPTCLRSGNFGYSMPYQDQNASPRCALWRFAERR